MNINNIIIQESKKINDPNNKTINKKYKLIDNVIKSSIIAFIFKISGYIVPEKYLEKPKIKSITNLVPIVMLSALVVVQTFAIGQNLVLDARIASLIIAIILLILRAPFIVVVISAALVAAILRYFGIN